MPTDGDRTKLCSRPGVDKSLLVIRAKDSDKNMSRNDAVEGFTKTKQKECYRIYLREIGEDEKGAAFCDRLLQINCAVSRRRNKCASLNQRNEL